MQCEPMGGGLASDGLMSRVRLTRGSYRLYILDASEFGTRAGPIHRRHFGEMVCLGESPYVFFSFFLSLDLFLS